MSNRMVGLIISVLVIAIVAPYALDIIAGTEQDVEINETESPEAAEAADKMFLGTYQGMGRIGTIINLQFVGLVIAAVLGFAYIVQKRGD